MVFETSQIVLIIFTQSEKKSEGSIGRERAAISDLNEPGILKNVDELV